jgi:integrase
MLARLKPDRVNGDDFVFASRPGANPVAYWNFRRRGFKPALEKAGLDARGNTIHDLRSAAASILVRQGLTPVEVAQVLGHADPNFTLRVYARLFDKQDFAARVRTACDPDNESVAPSSAKAARSAATTDRRPPMAFALIGTHRQR